MRLFVPLSLIVLLMACNPSSQPIEGIAEFDILLSQRRAEELSRILHSLDRTTIDNYIDFSMYSNNISQETMDYLDMTTTIEALHLIGIYGYFHQGQWHPITGGIPEIWNIEYFLTFEIGDGVYSMASYNNIVAAQLFSMSIMRYGRSIGTIRVWDVRGGRAGGKKC